MVLIYKATNKTEQTSLMVLVETKTYKYNLFLPICLNIRQKLKQQSPKNMYKIIILKLLKLQYEIEHSVNP